MYRAYRPMVEVEWFKIVYIVPGHSYMLMLYRIPIQTTSMVKLSLNVNSSSV